MDCTSSMGSWIDESKKTLKNLIESVRLKFKGELRIGFIGYRDFCDKRQQFEIKNFTSDIKDMQKFIDKLKPEGGGDLAEDVVGALKIGLK